MNNSNNLHKIGLAVAGLALALLLFNFFNMYNLVGNCPSGTEGCTAYSHWQLLNKVGIIILIVGIVSIMAGFITQSRNK